MPSKGTRDGKAAYAYAMMLAQAFNDTAVQQGLATITPTHIEELLFMVSNLIAI